MLDNITVLPALMIGATTASSGVLQNITVLPETPAPTPIPLPTTVAPTPVTPAPPGNVPAPSAGDLGFECKKGCIATATVIPTFTTFLVFVMKLVQKNATKSAAAESDSDSDDDIKPEGLGAEDTGTPAPRTHGGGQTRQPIGAKIRFAHVAVMMVTCLALAVSAVFSDWGRFDGTLERSDTEFEARATFTEFYTCRRVAVGLVGVPATGRRVCTAASVVDACGSVRSASHAGAAVAGLAAAVLVIGFCIAMAHFQTSPKAFRSSGVPALLKALVVAAVLLLGGATASLLLLFQLTCDDEGHSFLQMFSNEESGDFGPTPGLLVLAAITCLLTLASAVPLLRKDPAKPRSGGGGGIVIVGGGASVTQAKNATITAGAGATVVEPSGGPIVVNAAEEQAPAAAVAPADEDEKAQVPAEEQTTPPPTSTTLPGTPDALDDDAPETPDALVAPDSDDSGLVQDEAPPALPEAAPASFGGTMPVTSAPFVFMQTPSGMLLVPVVHATANGNTADGGMMLNAGLIGNNADGTLQPTGNGAGVPPASPFAAHNGFAFTDSSDHAGNATPSQDAGRAQISSIAFEAEGNSIHKNSSRARQRRSTKAAKVEVMSSEGESEGKMKKGRGKTTTKSKPMKPRSSSSSNRKVSGMFPQGLGVPPSSVPNLAELSQGPIGIGVPNFVREAIDHGDGDSENDSTSHTPRDAEGSDAEDGPDYSEEESCTESQDDGDAMSQSC